MYKVQNSQVNVPCNNSNNSGSEGNKYSMRDILNQDEIDSDSDAEDDHSDDSDADSDSDGEGLAMNTTSTTTTATTTSDSISAEEEIFILDGDDNAKKRTKSNTSTVSGRIDSTKSALVTGDSVRDQLLKEALGIDPSAIVNTATDATNTSTTTTTSNTTNTATNSTTNTTTTDTTPEEEPVPELRAYILPLYALMPAAQQNRVFLPVPPGMFYWYEVKRCCML